MGLLHCCEFQVSSDSSNDIEVQVRSCLSRRGARKRNEVYLCLGAGKRQHSKANQPIITHATIALSTSMGLFFMNTETVTAISSYIRDNADTPFEWGKFDCCIFTSHIINLQTEIDLYQPYAGKYHDEKSALAALKSIGSIESQMDKHFDRINPDLARRGDIHMLTDGVMAVQFSGHRWATTTNGVKPSETESKVCWRIK